MLQLAMILLLLPQQVPAQAEPAPPPPAPVYDEGPTRSELVGMREIRMRMLEGEMRPGYESDLRMQFRVAGDILKELSRYGNFIFTELTDDTGHSLINEDTYSEQERTLTRPNRIPAERMRQNGLLLVTRTDPAKREARSLKTVRGYVRLILATETEMVTVANPLACYGRMLESPILDQHGVKIRVVPLDEFETSPAVDRSLALQFVEKEANIRELEFVDGWMRPVRAPQRKLETRDGAECQVYTIDPSSLNNELQIVLEVHPDVKEIQVDFEADDLELP